jgi:hypothetical protein
MPQFRVIVQKVVKAKVDIIQLLQLIYGFVRVLHADRRSKYQERNKLIGLLLLALCTGATWELAQSGTSRSVQKDWALLNVVETISQVTLIVQSIKHAVSLPEELCQLLDSNDANWLTMCMHATEFTSLTPSQLDIAPVSTRKPSFSCNFRADSSQQQ